MLYNHVAFNIDTGEVLSCTKVNGLKRSIARNVRWSVRHGYGAGHWIFAHGSNAGNILQEKYAKIMGLV